jgi:hypothetical protein
MKFCLSTDKGIIFILLAYCDWCETLLMEGQITLLFIELM